MSPAVAVAAHAPHPLYASDLFKPLQLGLIGRLQHRVVLAPLTRNRASEPSLAPSPLAVQYYRQRASPGGLLITEATNISPESLAYPSTPGIWSRSQVEGWKHVTEAVHDEGGFVVCQLWHTGRVAHPSYKNHPASQNDNSLHTPPCVSASPIPILNRYGKRGKTIAHDGTIAEHAVPRALDQKDIARVCLDYKRAAKHAQEAGFDGVELHAAHGYLVDQFLNDNVNHRTDQYGGSVSNRCRLLREILNALLEVWPSQRVGVRLSPHDAPHGGNTYYACQDSNPDQVYLHAIKVLDEQYDLAYLLLTEPRWVGRHDDSPETDPGFRMPLVNLQKYRDAYRGVLMGAGGFTPTSSYHQQQQQGGYDALAFGRWFISNPDLPRRLQQWHEYERRGRRTGSNTTSSSVPAALNRYDRSTFYSQGAEGYIDYPSLEFEEFQQQGNSTSRIGEKKKFQGMVVGKYPLVDQQTVGTSLNATSTSKNGPTSKL